jgi:glyoxylase-like metal-dependent hydrolase (beta-lactamase superfamily II)
MKLWKTAAIAAGALALAALAVIALTPVVYAELFRAGLASQPPPADPAAFNARRGPAKGELVDGFWLVQQISADTWAIGEPASDPDNYEYLIAGRTRALLIDAGATRRDIHAVLTRLTKLPVTVIPTHLHYDHTNGLRNFSQIALVDLPETRAREWKGVVHLGRHQYMAPGSLDFRVGEWVRPDSDIDLGGKHVRLLWTPGHTATSISIWDPEAKRIFTGDYLYTTTLYAQMPDSSLSAYEATADRLLAMLPQGTTIYGAHCCRNDVPPEAPWLGLDDLRDARAAIHAVRAGKAHGRGFVIRRFPVNSRMTLLTLYPFGNW